MNGLSGKFDNAGRTAPTVFFTYAPADITDTENPAKCFRISAMPTHGEWRLEVLDRVGLYESESLDAEPVQKWENDPAWTILDHLSADDVLRQTYDHADKLRGRLTEYLGKPFGYEPQPMRMQAFREVADFPVRYVA